MYVLPRWWIMSADQPSSVRDSAIQQLSLKFLRQHNSIIAKPLWPTPLFQTGAYSATPLLPRDCWLELGFGGRVIVCAFVWLGIQVLPTGSFGAHAIYCVSENISSKVVAQDPLGTGTPLMSYWYNFICQVLVLEIDGIIRWLCSQ